MAEKAGRAQEYAGEIWRTRVNPVALSESDDAGVHLFGTRRDASNSAGYLQIFLSSDGRISLRGSRHLVDWLVTRLAHDGWQIELDEMRWCG